jgi:hypothetical protein
MGGDEGPDAVMSKPCRPDLLTALLKLLILRERASASPRSEPRAEPEAPAADTPPDEFPDAT